MASHLPHEEIQAQRGSHSKLELNRDTYSHLRPPLWGQDPQEAALTLSCHGDNVTRSAVSMTLRWTGWWSTVSSEL